MGLKERIKNFFGSKASTRGNEGVNAQSRPSYHHPFAVINSYVPLKKKELELYAAIREAVPIVDRAVDTIVRLVGIPSVESEDDKLQEDINNFLDSVKVNAKSKGFNAFITNYLDVMIQNGFAVGEVVPNRARKDIYALVNVPTKTIELKRTDNPLELLIAQNQPLQPEPVVFPYQDLIMFTALNPEEDSPIGVSLLRSMPFVTNILLKIFNSLGNNWERFGNLQFSVTYKPPDKADAQMSGDKVKERMKIIQDSFTEAMQAKREGKVKDFYGVGDVQVKVIGADGQILDSDVPVKQMLEQIVSKTGLPPFMLGLTWSTTERMSAQQADILTSELENYREHLDPVIRQIIDWWMRLTGKVGKYDLVWPDINLQDAVELARAELMKEQAKERKIKNALTLRNENIINQDMVAEELGYEKPVGPAPPRPDPNALLPTRDMSKKKDSLNSQFRSLEHRKKYWDALLDQEHHHEEKGLDDNPEIDKLMDRFEAAMFKEVLKLEKSILQIIGIHGEGKAFKDSDNITPYSHFYLTSEQQREIELVFQEFVDSLIGNPQDMPPGERYHLRALYVQYMMEAFGLGVMEAWQWVKTDIPEMAGDGPRLTPNFNSLYVRELLDNGMDLVSTIAENKFKRVLEIMQQNAAVGDNPEVWARNLYNNLHGELGGQRWYWRRLARSESAMAIDRAADEEYDAEGILYVEWVAAPDACRICKPLDNNIYTIRNAPKVVADTHPHCRCRKRPRTARYALESGRLVK